MTKKVYGWHWRKSPGGDVLFEERRGNDTGQQRGASHCADASEHHRQEQKMHVPSIILSSVLLRVWILYEEGESNNRYGFTRSPEESGNCQIKIRLYALMEITICFHFEL